jgi:phage-related protein
MYHSVTIGDKNSWGDWHLISKDRPYIAQPTPKTKYVELAGASGSIDLTDALTGLPTYNDRTGSLTFIINYDYWENWYDVYNDISNYLNGYRYKLMLEDEPYCYYIGRFSVSSYAPGNSASSPWATITINYTLYPYKYKLEDVLVATLKKDETISEYPSAVESEKIAPESLKIG